MNALVLLVGVALGQVGDLTGQSSQEALVQQIRENLAKIDELLLETAEADDVGSGLDAVRASQVQVVRDIEELIKQMKYSRSSQQSSSGGGESDSRPSSRPPPRESDGDSQDQPQDGQTPQSGEQQDQDQQGQEKPEDTGARDSELPRNEPGGPPPPDELGSFTREDTDDRWGLLPPKLQERLMNLHVDDVPERYRLWLEAYIRSMHRLESGDAGAGRR